MGGWSPIHYLCTVIGKTFIMNSPVGKCYIPPCPVKRVLIPDPFSTPQAKAADKQQLCPKVDFRTFLQRPPVNTTNKHSRLPVPLIWICPDMPGYIFQLLFTSRKQLALKTGSYLLVREDSTERQRPTERCSAPGLAPRGSRPWSGHRPRAGARLRLAPSRFSSSSCLPADPLPNGLLGRAQSPGKSPLSSESCALPPCPPNMTPCVGEEDRRPL